MGWVSKISIYIFIISAAGVCSEPGFRGVDDWSWDW